MGFKSDIEIAQECEMKPITEIAAKAGIEDKYLEQYGKYKAKIDYNLLKETDKNDGKLILVTAINPTPAGEGKTTTTVGLADAMQKLGKNVMVALREPSLGPVFGVKGGAAGGGSGICHRKTGPDLFPGTGRRYGQGHSPGQYPRAGARTAMGRHGHADRRYRFHGGSGYANESHNAGVPLPVQEYAGCP